MPKSEECPKGTTAAYQAHYAFHRRQLAFFEEAFASILKSGEESGEAERDRIENALAVGSEWAIVIMVTGVETYLVDVLSHTAEKCPGIMDKSEQKATYREVLEATDINELAKGLRRRWARRFIDGGGPTAWIKKLKGLGVNGYPKGMPTMLEKVWGIRHIVVHNGGIANAEFTARHPDVALNRDGRVDLPELANPEHAENVELFVQITDKHFASMQAAQTGHAGEP